MQDASGKSTSDERRAAMRRAKQEQWLRENPGIVQEGNGASHGSSSGGDGQARRGDGSAADASAMELVHAPRQKRPADERRATMRRAKQEQWLSENSAQEGNTATAGTSCPKKPRRRAKRRRTDGSGDDQAECPTEQLAKRSHGRWAPLSDRRGPCSVHLVRARSEAQTAQA
jgi:hypothetical protein